MGYYVFPVRNRQKFPRVIGGKTWEKYPGEKEQEMLHAHLMSDGGKTGAALCPMEDDPVSILILDIDSYGAALEQVWFAMAPGELLDEGVGVVRSASGGWHFWFRLPEDTDIRKLPADIDLGGGISGELRVSGPNRRLIMLPGSVGTNKNGKPGEYTELKPIHPLGLKAPPDSLMSRILARRGTGQKPETEGVPTEAHHVLYLAGLIEGIPEGERNNAVAKLGQVLGRICPAQKPTEKLLAAIWDKVQSLLGAGFDQKEFLIAINSGWKTGRKNAETYGPREKHPTVSEIREECEAVFGFVPWLCEVRDSSGKTKEWQGGFGGSAKRRNEAANVTKVKDLGEVLPTLTRVSGADPDTVVRSPLFIQPGWNKALQFMLQYSRGVDQLGIPAEEKFWTIIDDYARMAASDYLFIETWTGKRPAGSAQAFLVWPVDEPPSLVMPPGLQEALMTSIGDLPAAKRLAKKHLMKKTLVGMRSGKEVWFCPISVLEQTTQEFCGAQYEMFIRRNTNDSKV